MMSGLMLVFMFIAIAFMIEVESEKQEMEDVAISYRDTKANLNELLYTEFENDLQKWDANITKENSIIFNSPETLFEVGKSDIKKEFRTILQEFFSRYVKILTSKEFKGEIKELRVEGHTSKNWGKSKSLQEIYLKNMQLSQSRAFSVLSYCYSSSDKVIRKHRVWLEKHFRANGMAFSKLKESSKSRRVEFSIEMKSEEKVYEILK